MNLRVDLILETEQRSASIVNAKSALRVVAIVVPLLIVVGISIQAANLFSRKSALSNMNAELAAKEPKRKQAEALRGQLANNSAMLAELKGWKNSRVVWHRHLASLQKEVPVNMVFDSLRIVQNLEKSEGVIARSFSLTLRGKTYGENSEQSVLLLKRQLTLQEPFSKDMLPPQPSIKQDDTLGADPRDRLFQFDCVYKARKFE